MILPWLRIFLVVAVYLLAAVAASVTLSTAGVDLKRMESRTSPVVVVVGSVANLAVLAVTLLFLVYVDGRSLSALGLGLGVGDVLFIVTAIVGTGIVAAAFLRVLARTGLRTVRRRSLSGGAEAKRLATSSAVLFLVAVQEEVLFRGYVTLNLLPLGPQAILVVTTVLFTVIHFVTNRVTPAQVLSWLLGGFVLGYVYLASASIWVPILLHFTIDLTNVLAFNIAGDLALVTVSPPLADRQRAAQRAVHAAVVVLLGLAFYGRGFATRWYRDTLHPRPGEVEARAVARVRADRRLQAPAGRGSPASSAGTFRIQTS